MIGKHTDRGLRGVINRYPFLLSLLVLLAVVIPGFIRVEQVAGNAHHAADHANTALTQIKDEQQQLATTQAQLRALLDCIQRWATATTVRSAALTKAADARQQALDRLLRDAFTGASPAKLRADGRAYIKASDAYDAVAKKHPVPQPPRLHCVLYLQPPAPSPSPRPAPTRIKTVPTTVHAAGATVTATVVRTVLLPGATITETVVRTVTRTVTVPPGHRRTP